MGKKAKQVPQKHLKNNNSGGVNGSGAVKKRAERETKLRLRKERVASKKNYASAEEKEFSSELLEKGLEVHVVDGDGNCMFRSISDQLYGTVERHAKVRQKIVNYMFEHGDHFSLFIEDDEPFEDYIDRMGTAREWGGHQELFAASCCFNANIFVYQLQTPRWVLPSPDNLDTTAAVSVNLSYHGDYHYNSLRRSVSLKDSDQASDMLGIVRQQQSKGNTSSSMVKRDLLEQIQETLPWISAANAATSLEHCEYDFLKAIEHAIEHFFSADQEGSIEAPTERSNMVVSEKPLTDASTEVSAVVGSRSPEIAEAVSGGCIKDGRKNKKTKSKLPAGLSKKEKRLLKKEKHVGNIRSDDSERHEGDTVASVTSSVGDIIL